MKKILIALYIIAVFSLTSCNNNPLSAQEIVKQSIKAHGADVAANAVLEFNFRGIDYSADRSEGTFIYQRKFDNAGQLTIDRLDNAGFKRSINDSIIQLPDSLSTRYSASLNSVIYFAQLPYGLDGDAVILENLGVEKIKDQSYHQIKVTFKENGGGEDFEDVFVYWINVNDFMVDYLAYSFCEEDCGVRFRESVNRRNLNGIIVQDYNNYRSTQIDPALQSLDTAFEAGELILMSEIKSDVARVTLKDLP